MSHKSGRQYGFTLIELMVVIAIIGILAAIGVPGFQQMIQDGKLNAVTSDIVSTVQIARNEASTKHASVTVCPSDNLSAKAPTCVAKSNWSSGIIVNQSQDGGTALLKVINDIQGQGVTVSSSANSVVFMPNGTASAPQTITVRDSRPGVCRQIQVNLVGQVRSLRKEELVCPA